MADPHRRRLVYAVTVVVALVWAVLDQATKMAAVRTYSTNPPDDLGPIVLRLIYNEGGAFSLPIQLPWLYVGVTVLVCVLVVRALPHTDSLPLAGAYGLVVGGAIGNGADRIFRDGAVVDMIDLDFWPLEWFPVFNVADIGISIGAVAVFVFMVAADRRERHAERAVLDDDGGHDARGTQDPPDPPSRVEATDPDAAAADDHRRS